MSIIDIGYSGSQAAQAQLTVTAMNTANASTQGYTRQRVEQSAVGPMGSVGMSPGNGVEVVSIRRLSDQFMVSQVWRSNSSYQYYSMNQRYLSPLESVLSDESTSLSAGFDKFFAALSEATTQPSSVALRQQMLNESQSTAMRFNNMNAFMNQQKSDIHAQRSATVETVNTLTGNIATYNQKIMELEATGGNTSALRDQRDELVKELSTLMDVRVTEDTNGSYSVSMPSGQPLVSGRTASTLEIKNQADGTQVMMLAFAGSAFEADMSCGGQLGALHDYETGALKQMQDSLIGMAEAFANAVNEQLVEGYDVNGNPGQPLFVFDLDNPAGMLQVNSLKPEELAFSSNPDASGDGGNLTALIGLKSKALEIEGMGTLSLNEASASIISTIGIISRQNKTEATSALNVMYQAEDQRNALSGVNLNEEAINLMTYTQAYQANLKVISTGDKIFSDLLSMF